MVVGVGVAMAMLVVFVRLWLGTFRLALVSVQGMQS